MFASDSANLDPVGDGDTARDIYLRDLRPSAPSTVLISRASGAAGVKGDTDSTLPSVSDSGKTAFTSEATNLDAADTDPGTDVYLREPDVAPTVSITAAPARTTDTTPTITYSSTDEDVNGSACTLDAAPVTCNLPFPTTANFTPASPLSEAPHTFTVTLSDGAGNDSNTATATFTVDTTGPATQLDSQPPASSSDTTPTVTFSSPSADVASFACAVDGGAFGACASPFTTSPLAVGAHTIDVRATDDLGNVGLAQRASFAVESPPVGPGPVDPGPSASCLAARADLEKAKTKLSKAKAALKKAKKSDKAAKVKKTKVKVKKAKVSVKDASADIADDC